MFYVKRTEKIDFFIAAFGLKDNEYSSKIKNEFANKGLVEVNIYSYMEDDVNIFNYFSANGEKADFVIFSESNLNDMHDYVKYNYLALTSLEAEVPTVNVFDSFKYDSISYGIKIFDKADDTYNNRFKFKDLIEFTKQGKEKENYYLLVDNESPNFNKSSGNTLGYLVLDYFLTDMTV